MQALQLATSDDIFFSSTFSSDGNHFLYHSLPEVHFAWVPATFYAVRPAVSTDWSNNSIPPTVLGLCNTSRYNARTQLLAVIFPISCSQAYFPDQRTIPRIRLLSGGNETALDPSAPHPSSPLPRCLGTWSTTTGKEAEPGDIAILLVICLNKIRCRKKILRTINKTAYGTMTLSTMVPLERRHHMRRTMRPARMVKALLPNLRCQCRSEEGSLELAMNAEGRR